MHYLLCVLRDDPLPNGIPCYHLIEVIEVKDQQSYDTAWKYIETEYHYSKGRYRTFYFHIPTKDVTHLLEKE